MTRGFRMMQARLLGILFCVTALAAEEPVFPGPESVVVVANALLKESMDVARHYMDLRGIPEENLFLVKTANGQDITWDDYVAKVHNPLLNQLTEKGWIDATQTRLTDDYGRYRYARMGHKIGYMVVCYGIPHRIPQDATKVPAQSASGSMQLRGKNMAAVDAELSLIAYNDSAPDGLLQSPLYKKTKFIGDARNVVKVSRLDGPTPGAAKGMVNSAIAAEKNGLMGRAYIDIGGPAKQGDIWLREVEAGIRRMGYDLSVHDQKGVISESDRFDAPALYFGWYAFKLRGAFANPGFRFPPGAIAVHIHSYSAQRINDERYWVGPLVARGVTATVGNTDEPYLSFTHQLNLFFEALAKGWPLADAAYYSLPCMSWTNMLVGDPLYRPFKVSLDDQLDTLGAPGALILGQYAAIRKIRLMQAEGRDAEALAFALKASATSPGLALNLEIARLHQAAGNPVAAASVLMPVQHLRYFSVDDWIVVKEYAEMLGRLDRQDDALAVYRNLIDNSGIGEEALKGVLEDAARAALDAGDIATSSAWKSRLTILNTPPEQ